jgi:hypothetical protein
VALGGDHVPRAIDDAVRQPVAGADFAVGDVTDLPSVVSGTFDLFLDVGCFQGLTPRQRLDTARGVTTLAAARATVLLLAFQPTVLGRVAGGASRSHVERAFDGWEVLTVEAAETAGLGWTLSRTRPRWYRLRRSFTA